MFVCCTSIVTYGSELWMWITKTSLHSTITFLIERTLPEIYRALRTYLDRSVIEVMKNISKRLFLRIIKSQSGAWIRMYLGIIRVLWMDTYLGMFSQSPGFPDHRMGTCYPIQKWRRSLSGYCGYTPIWEVSPGEDTRIIHPSSDQAGYSTTLGLGSPLVCLCSTV